jgi:RNA polymerase sigma-70 factor (ECF subfamily)
MNTMIGAAGREIDVEADLIRRVCDGEKELYYELVQPYERSVYLAAFALLRNEADAEDAAQEAILKAFRHLKNFRGESRFRTWLVQITINEARMKGRVSRREVVSLDQEIENEDGAYTPVDLEDWRELPSEALERAEIREILTRALKELKPKYREVFVLRDVEKLSIADTAQILGAKEGVVKARLFRARLQLRDLIAPALRNSEVYSRRWFRRRRTV